VPGGKLLLEVSTCDAIYDLGNSPATWYAVPAGLFSNQAHVCLMESFYNIEKSVATRRYYVIDVVTQEIALHSTSYQGYTHSDFQKLLQSVGFDNVRFFDSLDPRVEDDNPEFMVVTCQRPG
jgi:hypothetical protein